MSPVRRRMQLALFGVLALVLAGASAAGVYRMHRAPAGVSLPVAPVREGEFLVVVESRGELKATRSVQIIAPLAPDLRVAWMAPGGTVVKEGDPVIRFDPSSVQQQVAERKAALEQAQATLDQSTAQEQVTLEQDKRDLNDARNHLEYVRLEASKKDILSRIQGEENKVDLSVAEQRLKVLDAGEKAHEVSSKARVASLTRQRDQARDLLELTEQRIGEMEVKAPLGGVLVLNNNYSQGWVNAKPFQVGDQVWPGAILGEIPDLSTLGMEGQIEETDRGKVEPGLPARVSIDSLPELTLPGHIESISPLTELSVAGWPPTRSFRALARIEQPDPRLRPSMSGKLDVVTRRIPKALSIPAKALFSREGKPVVFVAGASGYQLTPVEIVAKNPDEVAISGVSAGAMVTLTDPEAKEAKP